MKLVLDPQHLLSPIDFRAKKFLRSLERTRCQLQMNQLGFETSGKSPISARECFGHLKPVKILVILNPDAGYMLTSSRFARVI